MTTCQICARAIKTKRGVIAHHGYNRPGTGWQTASCIGAQHLPYEKSRDAIPDALHRIAENARHTRKLLREFLTYPPETLDLVSRGWQQTKVQSVARPMDFDATNRKGFSSPRSYETLFRNEVAKLESHIQICDQDYETLWGRWVEWQK